MTKITEVSERVFFARPETVTDTIFAAFRKETLNMSKLTIECLWMQTPFLLNTRHK